MKRKKTAKRIEREVAYWSEPAFLSFTEDLLRLMGDQVSQAELARRVGVSRGYISRVLRGLENLTLETMTKLALGVGASVRIHVAPTDRVTRWHDVAGVSDVLLDSDGGTASVKPTGHSVSHRRG